MKKEQKCENVKTEIICDLDPLSIDPSALIWIRIKYGSSGIKEYQSHHQRISPHSASSYQKASNYQRESFAGKWFSGKRESFWAQLSPHSAPQCIFQEKVMTLVRFPKWLGSQRLGWGGWVCYHAESCLKAIFKAPIELSSVMEWCCDKQWALSDLIHHLQVKQAATTATVASAMRGLTHSVKIHEAIFLF